jgi:hypothetical protein
MADYFDDVERQLAALCKQQPDRHRWWPELGRRPGTAIAFVASSLVALAVAALAVGLLHSASSRPAGGPPAGTPFSQLTPGQQRVVHNDLQAVFIPSPHPCDTVRHRPSKTPGLGTPPTPLLATLGVLRRPRTAADTLPHKRPSPPRNIYRRYVRRARMAFGAAYYVIPTFTTTSLVDPTRCVKVLARRFDHELQRVPAMLTPAFRQQFEGLIANVRPRKWCTCPRWRPMEAAGRLLSAPPRSSGQRDLDQSRHANDLSAGSRWRYPSRSTFSPAARTPAHPGS